MGRHATATISCDGETADTAERRRIIAIVDAALASDHFQPMVLSRTALDLVELARDPDVPLARVRETIETEPALAVAVLQTANSPFYSRGNPVDSLDDALLRLGVQRVSGIFMEAALRASAFSGNGYTKSLEGLRRHMTATGHIARGVSRTLKRPGERAFLCGLLHDIGLAGSYSILANLPRPERPAETPLLSAALAEVHERASAVMGTKWRLPWGVQWVIGHHHSIWVDGRISPLAALVALSDWLASRSGAPALSEFDDTAALQALEYFGFTEGARTKLEDRCLRIVEQLS